MINFVTGRPGAGKSFFGVMQICKELANTERFIVTNLPLNLEALADWCHDHIEKPVDLSRRLKLINDSEVPSFWLYSPLGRLKERVRLPGIGGDWEFPDFSARSAAWPGCLYVIDEVHLFFNARAWQKVTQDAEFFMSQHRHLRCDVILISQHPEKVDKNFRRNAQDFTEIRNLGNEKFLLGVSLRGVCRWATFLDCPRPGSSEAPMESGTFRFNIKEYGALYDTSAGVGLVGKISTNEQKRGRHPVWLVAACIAIIAGALVMPRALGMVIKSGTNTLIGYSKGGMGGLTAPVLGAVKSPQLEPVSKAASSYSLTNIVSLSPKGVDTSVSSGAGRAEPAAARSSVGGYPLNKELKCTGVCKMGAVQKLFLSDGREFDLRDPEVVAIGPNEIILASEGRIRMATLNDKRASSDPFAQLRGGRL